jgi:hypothetical protein
MTMTKIEISRGNCPCLRKDPRELAVGENGFRCAEDRCAPEDIWGALPEMEARAELPGRGPGPVALPMSRFRALFDGDFGDQLLLAISTQIRDRVTVDRDIPTPVHELPWTGPDSRGDLLGVLSQARRDGLRTSVLWIADDEFEHLPPGQSADTKLGAISFFSTGFSAGALTQVLRIIWATDYQSELATEQRLTTALEEADSLVLTTPALGASCRFRHQTSEHWFSLHGPLRWGDQTVLPTGEMSTLADDGGQFDPDSRLELSGDVVLKGSPIIHRGDPSVSRRDTAETYARLSAMEDVPVIARISGGWIQEFAAPLPESRRLRDAFRALTEAEPRYRKIHEFGFGTHRGCAERMRSNFLPNERCPGIHLGLGLGHYTPFHIDLALSEVQVLLESAVADTVPLFPSLGLRAF